MKSAKWSVLWRWTLRLFLLLILLVLLVWVASPWLLRINAVNSYIQSYVSQKLGGQISFEDLRLTLMGALSISDVHYDPQPGEDAYQIIVENAQILDYYQTDLRVALNRFHLIYANEVILSASKVDLILHNAWESPQIDAEVSRARINPWALPRAEAKEPSPPPDLSMLRSLRFSNSTVILPDVRMDYLWQGSVAPQRGKLSGEIVIAHEEDEAHHAQADFVWELEKNRLSSLNLAMQNFPLVYEATAAVSLVADGTTSVRDFENESYAITSDLRLETISAHLPQAASLVAADTQIELDMIMGDGPQPLRTRFNMREGSLELQEAIAFTWSNAQGQLSARLRDVTQPLQLRVQLDDPWLSWTPASTIAAVSAVLEATTVLDDMNKIVQAEIELWHEATALQLDEVSIWNLPGGRLSAALVEGVTAKVPLAVRWRSPAIGEARLEAATWPLSATTPLSVHLNIQNEPIQAVAEILPASLEEFLNDFSGSASLIANAKLRGSTLENYTGNIHFLNAAWQAGPVVISDASLRGPVRGTNIKHNLSLQGNAHLSLILSETGSLELDPQPLSVQIHFDQETGDYSVYIPKATTELFQDVAFSFASPQVWEVTGSMDASVALPPLADLLFPDLDRTIEGMGSVNLRMQGEGGEMEIAGKSEDLSIYSFEEEPAFGFQLRDVDWRMQIHPRAEGMLARMQLTGNSPYLTFANNDVEWPGDSFIASATFETGKNTRTEFDIHAPGGGKLHIVREGEEPYRIEMNSNDVEKFFLPIVNQMGLGIGEDESLVRGDGIVGGWLELDLQEEISVRGVLDFRNSTLVLDGAVSVKLERANLRVPISYPLGRQRFPLKEMTVDIARVSINEANYEDVKTSFPVEASDIILAQNLVLPIFGGRILIKQLDVLDWQSAEAALHGNLQLQGLQMSLLDQAYPYFPDVGELSGDMRHLTVSREVFSVTGTLEVSIFGGKFFITDLYISQPFSEHRIVGMTLRMEGIDLKRLTDYFEYGEMTGELTGIIRDLIVELPPAASGELPKPVQFQIELENTGRKQGKISRQALRKLVNLGQSGIAQSLIDRDEYFYSHLGLRASLTGNDLRMYGTAPGGNFLYADTGSRIFKPGQWFDIPVTIKLMSPEDVIDFNIVWQRLLGQIGKSE